MLKIIEKWMKWSLVKKTQNEVVLKATYVWFVVVPIIARLLSKLKDEITLTIGGEKLAFPLDLPFSWVLLYVAACSFIMANIIFRWSAPAIIKDNDNFGDFERSGKSSGYLVEYMTEYIKDELIEKYPMMKSSGGWNAKLVRHRGIYQVFNMQKVSSMRIGEKETSPNILTQRRRRVFEFVLRARDVENAKAIKASLLCLSVSASLLLIVTVQQITYVIKYIVQHGIL